MEIEEETLLRIKGGGDREGRWIGLGKSNKLGGGELWEEWLVGDGDSAAADSRDATATEGVLGPGN